ncbi:MAG TPA: hypothetical protein VJ847_02385 [Gemmatimonadales bacterium]|jgi:hypothetical protein|nr:hypothetical protein [Gemmatimonadales bacterium]
MEFPAPRGAQRAIRKGVGALLLAALATACTDRERLTFPSEGDQRGPITFIDQPGTGDTTVHAGPQMPLSGKTIDPDGVDSVYIVVLGGNETFHPFAVARDTARFGVSISTSGLAGNTMIVLVFGTDQLGNRGDTAVRRVVVTP